MYMKFKALISAVLLTFSLAAWAAEGEGEGTINKIKMDDEKLNITHGPIPGVMEMGMTMDFEVMDPAMLEMVESGDKVRFVVEEAAGGRFVVTDIETIGKGSVASDDGHGHMH
jgi:Cu/Ag efflux protein CusF